MKIKFCVFSILFIFSLWLIGQQISYALFSNSAAASGNVFATAAQFPSPTPISFPINPGDVVINEIMWAGSNLDSEDEWIELRNMTNHSIDLTGWKLLGAGTGDTVINLSGNIPANNFYLISNFNKANSILNIDPDSVTTNLQLDNTAAQYTLKDPVNQIIDIADDGSSSPLRGSPSVPKKSMSRNSVPGNGTLVGSWHTASISANLDPGASESATPKFAND